MRMTHLLKSATGVILLVGLLTGCPQEGQPQLRVTPTSATIGVARTARFAVEYINDRGIASAATGAQWSISDATIANLAVREDGGAVVTGVRTGNATLTVNYRGLTANATLTVQAGVTLARIEVAPANPSVAAGLTLQLSATGIFSDNTTSPFTNQVEWTSSNPQVLTIDNLTRKGLVTGVAPGTAVVTATSGGTTGQVTVTVTDAQLVSIAVTPTNPSVAAGTTEPFTATGTFTDNSTQNITTQVTWSSGSASIATVSNDAGSQGVATGVAPGTTAITATLGSVSGSTNLTVTSARLVSIAVTPTNPSLARGTNRQFTATGTFSNSTTQNLTAQVTWSSSDTNIATISDTAGSKGLASALNVGTTTITAALGSVSGTTTLEATSARLVAISITPTNPSLARGRSRQLNATGIYTDGTNQDITTQVVWESSDALIASVSSSPNTEGQALASNVGTVIITASQGTVTGTTNLTVTAAEVLSIAVTAVTPSFARGTTQRLTATGTFTDASIQDLTEQVTWASSNDSLATVSNVDGSRGLATAANVGTATITATLNGVSGTTDLTVTAAELVSIAITPTNPSVPLGATLRLTATGTYTDATTQNLTDQVTWSSSNDTIATIDNADGSEGLVTSVVQGSVTITATMGSVNGTATLSVTPAVLRSIAITPPTPSLARGTTQQLIATGTYTDNTTQPLTGQVTWTSSDDSIATVSNAPGSQGLATAVNLGPATITATMGSVSGTTLLTVTAARLVSIAITPTNPSLAEGTIRQLTATGTYTDATTQPITTQVTWASSNDSIATVSNAAPTQGLATAVNPGSVTITATMDGIPGSTTLTVTNAVLTAIEITPTNPSLPLGTTRQFMATGIYTDTTTQDLTDQVTWTSSNDAIATVSNAAPHGLATSVALGSVTVTATMGAFSGTTTLTVTAAELVSIAITPPTPSLPRGTTRQLTATGTYTDNSTQDITTQVTWLSSDGNVAPVSNADPTRGLATAANLGTVTITAAMGSVSGTTLLTVTAAELVSIEITPMNPSLPRGTMLQLTATGTYTDGTMQPITNQVTWTPTDPNIATVSNAASRGLATAVNIGTTVITATMGTVSATTTLEVTPAVLMSIAITPANPTVIINNTVQLTATGTYTDGTIQPITTQVMWSSSDVNIATVSNATGSQGLATAVAAGSVTITATQGSVSGTTTLTVITRTLTSITITPASFSLSPGATQQLTATGNFSDSSTQDLTTQVTWSSSSPTVATVGNTAPTQGLVTAVASGRTTITATMGSISGTSSIAVYPNHLVINEVDYDQVGTDTTEFVEIFNPTPAAIDLTNISVVFVNGSSTPSPEYFVLPASARVNLTGSLAPGGYIVVGNSAVTVPGGVTKINFTDNTFQNGSPDAVALLDRSTNRLVDALSYEGSITNATINSVTGFNLVEGTALARTKDDTGIGSVSIGRYPNGIDTDNTDADWQLSTTAPTPGLPNN